MEIILGKIRDKQVLRCPVGICPVDVALFFFAFFHIWTPISHKGVYQPHPFQIPDGSGDHTQNSKATQTDIQQGSIVVMQLCCMDSGF